ncbi:hypothetical protein NOR53_1436 [gamma proteobacterium NOR5-3]|nr:hypothetical protein NOR53_1436 [gamma proteobacterium NOR5-3]
MNDPMYPSELFKRLWDIDPELPRLALTLSQPCPNCDCGLKEAVEQGTALEALADTYLNKQKKCNSAIKTSFTYLLNHPVVQTVSGYVEPQAIEDAVDTSIERERVQS